MGCLFSMGAYYPDSTVSHVIDLIAHIGSHLHLSFVKVVVFEKTVDGMVWRCGAAEGNVRGCNIFERGI